VLVLLLAGRVKTSLTAFFLLAAVAAGLWQVLPKQSVEYATDVSGRAKTIHSRLVSVEAVMEQFRRSPVFGVGVGLRKDIEPHNVLVLTLGETGVAGLLFFCLMFAAAFYTIRRAWRRARGDPQSLIVLTIGAGVLLLTLVHGMVDVYWRRGVGVIGWAAVGMAVAIRSSPRAGSAETGRRVYA